MRLVDRFRGLAVTGMSAETTTGFLNEDLITTGDDFLPISSDIFVSLISPGSRFVFIFNGATVLLTKLASSIAGGFDIR